MPKFYYKAVNSDGLEAKGVRSGKNVNEIVEHLHEQGVIVLDVKEHKTGNWDGRLPGQISTFFGGKVNSRDLALFSNQFSTVLEAGIPLVRGLRGLATDNPCKPLAGALDDVTDRIERGENLSDAMATHPQIFNHLYMSMVRAGEQSGTLDEIIKQLAKYLERVDAIRGKVRSALAYPIFVLAFVIASALFLLLKIVPTFAEVYLGMGQSLPGLTQVVIDVSNTVQANYAIVLVGILALAFMVSFGAKTNSGRYLLDTVILNIPIFGPIVHKAALSRFARTFGILVRSGLPIIASLELVQGASGNAVLSGAINKAKFNVSQGLGITDAFRNTKKFPEMVIQLMATGEESGNLDNMLLKTSDFYDRQVEASVHSLTSLIEPIVVVVVGGLIGVIVVSMFLPIFYMGDAIMMGGANL